MILHFDPQDCDCAPWQDFLCPKAEHWQRLCSEGSRNVSVPFIQK